MNAALLCALFCTVALLVVTAYFIMGSVPLLTLKHDTPMDSRFVRGFFNVDYGAAMVTAGATALSYAFAGRLPIAAGAAVLAVLAFFLRRTVIPRMDSLGAQIQQAGQEAIPDFRRVHATAIVLNVAQLAVIVWSLMGYSAP